MDKDLKAIKEAWESRPAAGQASSGEDGQSLAEKDSSVYAKSDKYVDAHPDEFAGMDAAPMDLIVAMMDRSVETGDEATYWKYQVWLWHRFEPQVIGGTYEPKLRSSNG